MSGRYMSRKDLHEARREQEIFNSMVRRGVIDRSKFTRTAYVVCGCGVEGCGFITKWMREDNQKEQKL